MSTTTLQFELRQGGTLTDPDGNSVLLSDATGTYGARRTDTLGIVVADGTPMVRQSAGVYTADVTDPAAGLTYQWVAEYAVGGVTKHDTFTAYAYGAGLTGFWTTQAQVQQIYADENTSLDADLNNDGTGTAAVWQRALDSTDARLDLLMASYLKTRPASQSGTSYTFVSRVAAAQVRYELHKGRGQTEANAAGGPNVGGVYKKEADDLWAELVGYLDEQVIDFPDVTDTAGAIAGTAPVMLRPTVDAEGRTLVAAADYDRPYFDPNLGGYRW